jgi:hypothetical protein
MRWADGRRLGLLLSLVACAAGVAGARPVLAQAARAPVDVTILRSVSLPWQDPEVIVSTVDTAASVHVELVIDGSPGPKLDLQNVIPGMTRSIIWKGSAGRRYCEVRVWGLWKNGDNFRRVWASQVDVMPPLKVELAASDVNLVARTLRFRSSSTIGSTDLSLFDLDGRLLHQVSAPVATGRPGHPITVTWPALSAQPARIALRVFGADERADSWADVEWSFVQVEVPHAPIFFPDTIVLGGQAEKMDAAFVEVKKLIASYSGVPGLRLFLLGLAKQEAQASAARDQAIAVGLYFKGRGGIGLPMLAGGSVEPDTVEGNDAYVQAVLAVDEPAPCVWLAIDPVEVTPEP